ncbi:M56 family metallopeptidase [Fusibacter bizertensis]
MIELFISVLNRSVTAIYVILFVILVRILLKKAPKFISYALWIVVAFRLMIPFSFESMFSLMPSSANAVPIPLDIIYQESPQIESGIKVLDAFVNHSLPAQGIGASANPLEIYLQVGAYIWVLGLMTLIVYSLVSIYILKRQLKSAKLIEENIFEAKNLKTPFVIGFIRPKIYLPEGLRGKERSYILLHEQTHIQRNDHIVKAIAFIILSIHWFNPFVWIAFRLISTDMELSCDEKVLGNMDEDIKKPYATSLLSLATGRHILNGGPLAFSGGTLKGRIKNVLNYQRPKYWVIAISIFIVAVIGIGLISNPKAIGIIGGADGPTDIIISPQDRIVIAESDKGKLYANSTNEGIYKGITVETKDKSMTFSWINVTNPTYAPTINVTDINNDGKEEVIIILITGYGTGVLQQEIHILNREDLYELNIQDPLEAIHKKVTSTIINKEGKVNVNLNWDGKVIEKSYSESDAGIWFDEVAFGAIINYEIIDNKITASIPGAVSPSEFPVLAFIEYTPELEIDTITILDQE